MRRPGGVIGGLAAAAALVVGLTACSQTAESALAPEHCVRPAGAGNASRAVATTGEFGGAAVASFPVPLRTDAIEVNTSGAGTGAPITEHGIFAGSMQVFDGATGVELLPYTPLFDGADGDAAPITLPALAAELPGLATALTCARAGQRITVVVTAAEYFGPLVAGRLADPSATLVAVVDVARVLPSSASGVVLPPEEGMPAVVNAPNGQPGITMPEQQPPSEQRSGLRIRGFGPEVTAGDELTLHMSVFSWETGGELGSTWDAASSVLEVVAEPGPVEDGLFGATSALVGQAVGSQVIVIVPPEQAEAFTGPQRTLVNEFGALVLVIDILAADPPGA